MALADRLTESHAFKMNHSLSGLRDDAEASEIVDDVAYYANLDITYIWTFTLWRIQAVFEGIISQSLLPLSSHRPLGLKRKLKALKAAGYAIAHDDEEQLLEWAKLRNRFSHRPEWYYHATRIWREDVAEYASLVTRL